MIARIVLAGVGGQGIITAARFLAEAAHRAGIRVVAGQLHGMTQRGGVVRATVVLDGDSSIVADGTADVLLATEPLEAVRALPALRPGGLVVTGTRPSVPAALTRGHSGYPPIEELTAALAAVAGSVVAADATSLASLAGSSQVANVVLLGLLGGTGRCPVPEDALLAVLRETGSPVVRAVNERAYALGREHAASAAGGPARGARPTPD